MALVPNSIGLAIAFDRRGKSLGTFGLLAVTENSMMRLGYSSGLVDGHFVPVLLDFALFSSKAIPGLAGNSGGLLRRNTEALPEFSQGMPGLALIGPVRGGGAFHSEDTDNTNFTGEQH
jgi:hypothetical protein